MMELKRLSDLNLWLWKQIISMYLNDPLTHCYLIYDLIYNLKQTDLYLLINERSLISYLLIWRGPGGVGIHVWNYVEELLDPLKDTLSIIRLPSVIQLYGDSGLSELTSLLKELSLNYEVKTFKDMVVDEVTFKPFKGETVKRLNVREHLRQFLEIKLAQGRRIEREDVVNILKRYRYYGILKDGKLVSIACSYLSLPEVWIVGDVFTLPEYRGRGYAKAVTSAVTKDCITSGAKAVLHVRSDNIPAIKVYEKLGYKAFRERPWIFINPRTA